VVMSRGQLRLEHLARDAIDRRCRDRSGVHVEPNTRTLGKQPGPPTNCRIGRAGSPAR
jgi:hypothetical protein